MDKRSGPPLPPPPLAVAAVLLFSRDADALAGFYREQLGIPLAPIRLDGVPPHWACDIGDFYVSIWPEESEDSGAPERRFAAVAFQVRDVWLTFDRLREDGVEVVSSPTRSALGLIARLKDPDGNPFELYQPLRT